MHFEKMHPRGDAPSISRFSWSQSAAATTLQIRGTSYAQRAIRFSEKTNKRIREATEKRGFSSPTAFIRHAVEQELSGHGEELVGAEERLAATIEQVRQGMVPPGASATGLVRVGGQSCQDSADLYSRTGRTRVGSGGRQGARQARPIVEERRPGDGRRVAAGDAGVVKHGER